MGWVRCFTVLLLFVTTAICAKVCEKVACTEDCVRVDSIGQCPYCRCKADKKEICYKPVDYGSGLSHYVRYYYHDGVCKEFSYKGKGGNRNNFESLDACNDYCGAEACPQLNCEHHCKEIFPEIGCPYCECADCPKLHCPDLCKTVIPEKGCSFCECHDVKCDSVNCASGCIVESVPGKCPKCNCDVNKVTCLQHADQGDGKDYLLRYYHEDGMCKTFIYSGKGGNSNKFMSRGECEEFCGVKSCPSLKCHHGCQPEETYKDCPKKCVCEDKYNICKMPVMEGFGEATNKRYYYDPKYGVCDHFYYKGKGGNYNNFKSQKDCESFCEGFKSTSVCQLYKDSGSCEDWETRYYFDTDSGKCKEFSYGGCHGNGNNFVTLEECQNTCKVEDDPCTSPKDAGPCFGHHKKYYYDPQYDRCSIFYYGGCYGNKNKFDSQEECEHKCKKQTSICHLQVDKGSCNGQHKRFYYDSEDGLCKEFYFGGCDGNLNNFKNKYECEAQCMQETDLCKLEKDSGSASCYGNIERYYFNYHSGDCKTFIYTGCDGNSNNFVTQDECEAACKEQTNLCQMKPDKGPCHERYRRYFYSQLSGNCELFYYGGCEGNENRFRSKAACEKKCGAQADACDLLPERGPCHGYIQKYYYNKHTKRCEHFTYGGCEGNENNFDDIEQCEGRCKKGFSEHLTDICSLKADKGPCKGNERRYFFNSEKISCQLFYFGGCDGNANNFKTLSACEEECKPSVDVCHLRPEKGQCYGHLQRFFFDKKAGDCKEFVYGGCDGNENNFKTLKECRAKCMKPETDICTLNPAKGPCYEKLQRFYFNHLSGKCENFYYGGCEGNANNFESIEHCQKQCGIKEHLVSAKCTEKPDKGPCYGHIERFYFDPSSGRCRGFTYGGCEGNENNFKTVDECLSECKSNEKDLCLLKPDAGPCYEQQKRFYFNSDMRQCLKFNYGGCEGNENNFKSLSACEKACQQNLDVCSSKPNRGKCYKKSTRYYFNPATENCEKMHACDIGGNNFPTEDECLHTCAQSVDICSLAVDKGPCYQSIERFFYNTVSGTCQKFTYGGCRGNENNFRSEDECETSCMAKSTDVCSMKPDKGPCYKKESRYHYDETDGLCKVFTYGGCEGNANNFKTKYECENNCMGVSFDPCALEPEKGPCYGHIERYFFSKSTGSCETFVYSGCEGNANNFITVSECKEACAATPKNSCELKPEKGPCYGHLQRYYFDPKSNFCHTFTYGGCEGNANNYKSIEECKHECLQPMDLCELKPEKGPCYDHIERYYFDSSKRSCSKFIFGGCEGNGNNFHTLEACQKECIHSTNICTLYPDEGTCYEKLRRYYFDEQANACKPFKYTGCGGNENNFQYIKECETRCIHAETNVCHLDPEKGLCYGHEMKYFYNKNSGLCEQFVYGGCDGNGNNFNSMTECEKKCKPHSSVCGLKPQKGPCYENIRKYFYDSLSDQCEPFVYGGCQGNGNNFGTLEECLAECKQTDVCSLKPEKGPCYGKFQRFFFDNVSGKCEHFVYGGCEGNENNFETKLSCEAKCMPHADAPYSDICALKSEKGPCYEQLNRFFFNSHSGKCERFIYGGCEGNGNNFKTLTTCESRCLPEKHVDVCSLPKDKGPCYGQVVRYHFNTDSSTCQKFTYGGCEGNSNNFGTKSACEKECLPHKPYDVCSLPKEEGSCYKHIIRYYFNSNSGTCEQFTYGGCDGNENNFKSIIECKEQCHPQANLCELSPEKGSCYEHLNRYFFNSKTGSCERFIYSGCEGNENNFQSVEKCLHECKPPTTYPQNNLCHLPPEKGSCYEHMNRYFFNSKTDSCERFIYSGCEGNENNFLSAEKCLHKCKPETDVCAQPAKKGPCYKTIQRYFFNGESCQMFIYGGCEGNANNFESLTLCQEQCHLQTNVCDLPPEKGPCYEHLSRYFFNSDTNICERFIYSGCEGNENNFQSVEKCIYQCKPQVDVCAQPPEKGPCYKNVQRYFFNGEFCEMFIYGGCDGNENNFESLKKCQEQCHPQVDFCQLSADKGPCHKNLQRYYFDNDKGMCEPFYYGGCGGNENRFSSKQECQKNCMTHEEECPILHCAPDCWESTSDLKCPTCVCPDSCSLSMDEGYGESKLRKYYFDSEINICKQFYYRGSGGNANNFATMESCSHKCEPDIPCDDCPKITCPKTCWKLELDGYCPACSCPRDCMLNKDVGKCSGKYERYYYNHHSGECEKFYYGGCEGNGNHFFTRSECEKRCPGTNDRYRSTSHH